MMVMIELSRREGCDSKHDTNSYIAEPTIA